MPYKDPEKSREYQRDYARSVRQAKFHSLLADAKDSLGGACTQCCTTEALDFDHVDPKTKLFNVTSGGSVSAERFWTEVAKCQLLCRPHHEEKTSSEKSKSGESHGLAKLRELDVLYIRGLRELGHSQNSIAKELGCLEEQ